MGGYLSRHAPAPDRQRIVAVAARPRPPAPATTPALPPPCVPAPDGAPPRTPPIFPPAAACGPRHQAQAKAEAGRRQWRRRRRRTQGARPDTTSALGPGTETERVSSTWPSAFYRYSTRGGPRLDSGEAHADPARGGRAGSGWSRRGPGARPGPPTLKPPEGPRRWALGPTTPPLGPRPASVHRWGRARGGRVRAAPGQSGVGVRAPREGRGCRDEPGARERNRSRPCLGARPGAFGSLASPSIVWARPGPAAPAARVPNAAGPAVPPTDFRRQPRHRGTPRRSAPTRSEPVK